ncbi:hypothetical protein N657DRAFT_390811 [Parathielavia appendiculata]|uniref:Rhodopsin domain-containing protein n=1 Tax=Parathielavia appendiculata TaxID=2587402 RepID=A0AAN6U101_9PEZI|nr:hypothetical protein N657DRAFT_390811 [Parathielavia appendiculata]
MATENTPSNTGDLGRLSRLSASTDFGPQINFTLWLLTALSATFLTLRVWCKSLRHRGLWWDDHLLIAAWLCLVVDCSLISACINLGFGRPLTQFKAGNLAPFLLYSNLAGTFSILAALWSKTSFAVTVLRISSGWVKASVWFIIVTVNACLGVAIVITWAQCTPVEKVWRPGLDGECWPKSIQVKYNIFTAVYSGAMDMVLAVVPWKIIWGMTMNRKEKIGVMVAMSMGVFAGITSIIKITQLPSISNATFTESTTQLVILAAAESAITIIAASIPILRALIRDSRPPHGPAQFYHTLDFSVCTGTHGSHGTGSNSVVITGSGAHGRSGSRHGRSTSRSQSRVHSQTHSRSASSTSAESWKKSMHSRSHSHAHSHSRTGNSIGGLSLLSGLSVTVLGGAGRRGVDETGQHGRSGSGAAAIITTTTASGRERPTGDMPVPTPPPGRILATEEVVVEFKQAEPFHEWQGKG